MPCADLRGLRDRQGKPCTPLPFKIVTSAQTTQWVFLRGLVRESAHWDDFPERFAQAVPGARVYPIDLPGNGLHWRQTSPLNMRRMMEAVRNESLQLAQAQDQSKAFYLLSVSLGSMVAVEWAQQHPEELAGIVLVNTSLRGLSPLRQRLSCRIWPLLARIIASGNVAKREHLIFMLTSALKEPSPGLIENRVGIHQRHPVALANVFRQLWAAARHHPALEKPSMPLLLLNSLGDRMVDPNCTHAIARQWNVEPKTHPWAGHDLPLDDPDWVVAKVVNWLESQFQHC